MRLLRSLAAAFQVVGSVALIGCASKAAGQADAHDDSALFVQGVLAPPAVPPGQTCLFTNNPAQPYLSSGLLDVSLRQEYDATYLLGSTAPTMGEDVVIGGATVRITDNSGNLLNSVTRLASGAIAPTSGNAPGYAPVTVTTLDEATLQSAGLLGEVAGGGTTRLVTYVTFFGGVSGASMQTDEFEFPVDVCDGCLVSFPARETDPNAPQPNCLAATSTSGPATSPCMRGQDSLVDCSQCQGIAACEGAVADAGGK